MPMRWARGEYTVKNETGLSADMAFLQHILDGLLDLDFDEDDEPVSIESKDQLHQYVLDVTGIDIPRTAVCKHHCAPFDAFATAYFGKHPVLVWKASRGFGGKSVMLAALGFVLATSIGASVNLLGGSGEQSKRVHDYMAGDEPNLPDKFWKAEHAPRWLLTQEPTKYTTRLTNHGRLQVLTASQKSVRGPHPQALLLDEADEIALDIFDAALGQPMSSRGIKERTVISSTHQNADGTMTEVLKRAAANGWPTFEWCYKETLQGWLTQEMIERKKLTVSAATWDVEYEMQEPAPESRAIMPEKVQVMFKKSLGEFVGGFKELVIAERPSADARYACGADWAKKRDRTVFVVVRYDCSPARVVAFMQMNRMPWPQMTKEFDKLVKMYDAEAIHDATGLGTVVDDLLEVDAIPIVMTGQPRANMFAQYVKAIENEELEAPYIDYMRGEHYHCKVEDLQTKHPPDSVVAGALAWIIAGSGAWTR